MYGRVLIAGAVALACAAIPAGAGLDFAPAPGEGKKNRTGTRSTWSRPPERLNSKGHSDSLLRMLGKKKRRG